MDQSSTLARGNSDGGLSALASRGKREEAPVLVLG
jgi:hypothetical protein